MITSWTSSGRMRARSTAARIAAAPSSGAAKPLSSPWNAPIGVRERPTMTMGSFCMQASFKSVSTRQFVRTHEAARALGELRRERAGFAGVGVDLHAGQDADGADLSGGGVAHFVHELGHSLAHLDEGGAHRDGIAGEELAPVSNVLLHGRHAPPVLFQEGGRDPGRGEEIPGRFIELAHVPHDVHVAHVVAVPRIDHAAIGLDEVVHAVPSPASAAVPRIASKVSASRRSISCAAGSARESGAAWPAHIAMQSGLPALAEAWRSFPVMLFCAGKGSCGACAISVMKRLTRPRAGLPLNFSVIRVPSSRAASRACLCTCEAPLSGHGMNAVPSCAACAPSASTAAIPAPSMIPPAATTGTPTSRTMSRVRASVPVSASYGSPSQVPRWPPASPPCAMMKSTPSDSSIFASAILVALPPIRMPAAWNFLRQSGGRAARWDVNAFGQMRSTAASWAVKSGAYGVFTGSGDGNPNSL